MRPRDFDEPNRLRFYRLPERGVIAGVCAGLADYFGVRPLVVRAIAIAFALIAPMMALVTYAIAAWLAPRAPQSLYRDERDADFWRCARRAPSAASKDLQDRFAEIERRLRRAEAHVTSKSYGLAREIDEL